MRIETLNRYHILIDIKDWYIHGSHNAWNNQVLGHFLDEFFVILIVAKVLLVKLEL